MRQLWIASVLVVAVAAGITLLVEAQQDTRPTTTTKPAATKPAATKPAPTKPAATKPAPKPAATKPAQAPQPAAAKPAPVQQVAVTENRDEKSSNFLKDSWLTSKVKTKIFADKRVKGMSVNVATVDAVVILRGKVATAEARRAAEEVARGTDGVRGVMNALQVVPEDMRKAVDEKDDEIKKAIKARLGADQALADADISVRSDNAVVTLMGSVPDARTGARAVDHARRVEGVRSVRNEVRPKPAPAK